MASNNTGSFFHGWPLWLRIFGVITAFVFVAFLIIGLNKDVQIGPGVFRITRSETPLERNCRLASQQASTLDQEISNEILALEAQVAAKDRELSETRAKCLAAQGIADHAPPAVPTRPDRSRCRTEISSSNGMMAIFANPQGAYETALTSAAQERDTLQSKIATEEQLRTQRQQRLEQACFGADDSTGKDSRAH